MLSDDFTRLFREEHRAVRDALLDLVEALRARDFERARALLGRTAALTGPHFRYEEEVLYPSLTPIFGEGYVRKLLTDHDRAIGIAAKLAGQLEAATLTEEQAEEAVRLVRRILPHVSDCDGLSIMVERLPEEQIAGILAARNEARAANLDLLRWANEVRKRRYIVP